VLDQYGPQMNSDKPKNKPRLRAVVKRKAHPLLIDYLIYTKLRTYRGSFVCAQLIPHNLQDAFSRAST
jgi:hypothetical protein